MYSNSPASIRSRLVALVLVSLFPVLIFAGSLASFLTYRQIESIELGLKGTTKALSEAIDRQIVAVIASLQILTETEDFDLDGEGLRILHQRLRKIVVKQKDWKALAYSGADGKQIFNTARAYGEILPNLRDQNFFLKAAQTGKVSISGFREGLITKAKIISIAIPVKRGGKLKYVLIASMDLMAISNILKDQILPKNWTASILDSNSLIIGRSRDPEKYLGQEATPKLASLARSLKESFFKDENDGTEAYGAFTRSQLTDWTVVLGAPHKEFIGPALQTFWIIVVAGLVFVGLGIALAFVVGSRISKPILELSLRAKALGLGDKIKDIDTNLHEVIEVIGALRKAADQREISDQKAQDAISLRDTFLSVASHELKTPITAIQLNLQMLLRSLKSTSDNEKHISLFTKALYQVSRLTSLVNELLDVSAITAGKMQFHFEEVNLNDLVNDIISRYPETKIELLEGGEVCGEWDRGRLEQVLTNLVSNAVKYGENRPVLISIEKEDREVHIAVKDQGQGIAEDDQHRVFQKFERAVDGTNSISGLGLGLWITDEIVKGLSGRIVLESKVGQGSTFTVIIPIKRL